MLSITCAKVYACVGVALRVHPSDDAPVYCGPAIRFLMRRPFVEAGLAVASHGKRWRWSRRGSGG